MEDVKPTDDEDKEVMPVDPLAKTKSRELVGIVSWTQTCGIRSRPQGRDDAVAYVLRGTDEDDAKDIVDNVDESEENNEDRRTQKKDCG